MSKNDSAQPLQHYERPKTSRRQDPHLRHPSQKKAGGKHKGHTSLWVSLIIIAILIISIGPVVRSQMNHQSRQDLASSKVVKQRQVARPKKVARKTKVKRAAGKTKPAAKITAQSANAAGKKTNVPTASNQKNSAANSTYTVKSGDSLSNIASRYGTTVDRLVQLNRLTSPEAIQPGQNLKLK